MTITFPLTPPASPGPRSFRLGKDSVVGLHQSPFDLSEQVQRHAGERWRLSVNLPAMKRPQAEEWIGFLVSLNGMEGTFLQGDPAGATPRGIASGTPLVDGAAQTGPVLDTKGWTASQTGILKRGDWLQLGSASSARLHKVLADADSDGAGLAALDIWPRLRASPADSDPIAVTGTVGVFRLAGNRQDWDVDEALFFGIGFAADEVV